MHLVQGGVSLDIVRDFLGHIDIKTTELYARANLEMKRAVIEKVSATPVPDVPSWKESKIVAAMAAKSMKDIIMPNRSRGPPANHNLLCKASGHESSVSLAFAEHLCITTYFAKYTLWKAFHNVYLGS